MKGKKMETIPVPEGLPEKWHELYRKSQRAETPDWMRVDVLLEELAHALTRPKEEDSDPERNS